MRLAMARRGDPSGRHPFPATRPSLLHGISSDDPDRRARSRDVLIEAYWKPIYKYARLRWRLSASDAEDVTQEFFLRCLDLETFAAFDPGRARFRTFLRVCFDRFATDRRRRDHAVKRGGGSLAVDFAAAEHEVAASRDASSDPELLFEREWARHLMSLSLTRLREELTARGKHQHLRVFERMHLDEAAEPPSYAELGRELGISVTDVTNRLSYARREFRRIAMSILRAITADHEEFRAEVRALFGSAPDADGAG